MAGLFVAAQAADLDARWKLLNNLVSWVAPMLGALAFFALAFSFTQSSLTGAPLAIAFGFAMGGSAIAALSTIPWFANGLVALFFRTTETSYTLRLAARLALLCLLLAVPGWFAFHHLLEDFSQDPGALLEGASLGTGLLGYIALALAAVGFLVRRNWRDTIDRLGLAPMTLIHFAVAIIGLVALVGLNFGADWFQHTFLPELWERDQQINQSIAQDMTIGMVLLLGLSAGIGEEVTLRGALQPKLGIVLTALLFASLHVQYSWFGMMVIFVLGLLLGLIRRYTTTTVAVLIHVLYDVMAVFSIAAAE